MRRCTFIVAALFTMAPFGATASDLVVWWPEGFYVEEDTAVRDTIAAFEQGSGEQVELVLHPLEELPDKIVAALESGHPPDFVFGFWRPNFIRKWALEDRLVDLTDTIGRFSDLFDPNQLERAVLLDAKTGRKALYGLPMGQISNYIHVWKSLLERAGLSLNDIPKEWEPFWAFWCDRVQPAVRRALGRDDIWGVGRPMAAGSDDTTLQFFQFVYAYDTDYVTRDGKLVIDEPEIRRRLIEAIESYTAAYRKGCTPPDAVTWDDRGNNQAFLARTVVMTTNNTLSIPNAIKVDRPEDYYDNTTTTEWPLGPSGKIFPIEGTMFQAVVFKDGGNLAAAEQFVRFLVAEGWLMHYLNFSGERMLPSIPALLDQPCLASGDLGHDRVFQEHVWAKAIHRIVTAGISPEQAVDDAIARIKEILSE